MNINNITSILISNPDITPLHAAMSFYPDSNDRSIYSILPI